MSVTVSPLAVISVLAMDDSDFNFISASARIVAGSVMVTALW